MEFTVSDEVISEWRDRAEDMRMRMFHSDLYLNTGRRISPDLAELPLPRNLDELILSTKELKKKARRKEIKAFLCRKRSFYNSILFKHMRHDDVQVYIDCIRESCSKNCDTYVCLPDSLRATVDFILKKYSYANRGRKRNVKKDKAV